MGAHKVKREKVKIFSITTSLPAASFSYLLYTFRNSSRIVKKSQLYPLGYAYKNRVKKTPVPRLFEILNQIF